MPSQEFIDEADRILGSILHNMTTFDRDSIQDVTFFVDNTPNQYHMQATGTPPDHILLGIYEGDARSVTIFEQSLKAAAHVFGNLLNAIWQVLDHEIYQHALGWDHVLQTEELGLMPAFAISSKGESLRQWESPACG